jgi:hypothetical protein
MFQKHIQEKDFNSHEYTFDLQCQQLYRQFLPIGMACIQMYTKLWGKKTLFGISSELVGSKKEGITHISSI